MGLVFNGQSGVSGTPGPDSVSSPTIVDGSITIDDLGPGSVGLSELAVPATKGYLLTHNGTTQVEKPVGADGLFLKTDSSNAEGIVWSSIPTATPVRQFTLINSVTTLTGTEDVVLCDSTGGLFNVNLPAAPSDGMLFDIKKTTGSPNVTIQGNGKLIDGSPSETLTFVGSSRTITYSTAHGEWVIL